MTAAQQLTARDIVRALYWHYSGRYAFLTEVSARPSGPVSTTVEERKVRRIDVLLLGMNAACDGGIERIAIEVKVSRSDYLSDINNPAKQAPWRALAHRHAYAAPVGLIGRRELPGNSGLLEVSPAVRGPGSVKTAVRMPRDKQHDPGPLPLINIMDGFWRAGRAEAQLRGYGYHGADDEQTMRGRIKALESELARAQGRAQRAEERGDRWRKVAGAAGPLSCSTCGSPLTLARGRSAYSYSGDEWQHRDAGDADACLILRTAAAESANTDRWRAHVPGPEPVDVAMAGASS